MRARMKPVPGGHSSGWGQKTEVTIQHLHTMVMTSAFAGFIYCGNM